MDNFINPDWPAPANIHAYSTTRHGGFSQAPFNEFNLGLHVGDYEQHVLKNRRTLTSKLNLPAEPLWLNQVHSNQCVNASYPSTKEADASFTNCKNTVCLVMTADCLPILLCDQEGSQIAAIHAGWRGLNDGIIRNTVAKFNTCSPIMAWLGPCISQQHFEVGSEVREAFLKSTPNAELAFIPQGSKYLASLPQLAQSQLIELGVEAVYSCNECTFSKKDDYFSYRRDQQTGRMASLLWIS